MKFSDPLSTLQYMGGAPPIHIAQVIFASYLNFKITPNIRCGKHGKGWIDVSIMMYVHIICLVFYVFNKILRKSKGNGKYIYYKTFLTNAEIVLYMGSYLYMQ